VRSVAVDAGWPNPAWQHRIRVLSAPLTRRPSPVASVYSRRFASAVESLARSWSPDIVQVEHDGLAYCATDLSAPRAARVLVCHDPGLKASSDQAQITRGRQRAAHLMDVMLWRHYWSNTLPRFDAVVTFSDDDAAALRPYALPALTTSIPIGIELPSQSPDPLGASDPAVLFVGGYSHPPNGDAALRLVRSIMPLVRGRHPDARLWLVGDRPTEAMKREAGDRDVITGTVDRVEPFLDDASVIALPIRLGGGMRVKLLEALGAGKAIVASPRAAASLSVSDGQELLIAETDEEFARAIVRLLADSETRGRLARNARAWAERNLGLDATVGDYERLYARLLASSRPVQSDRATQG
jgi:glycosyltransferase involved in cell wall biosynthesis